MFERIEFVPFEWDDTRTLWEIRNHEAVRRFMSRPQPIDYARHQAWVRRHLLDEQTDEVHFVRLNGEVRGFVLVRERAETRAEFGIMLSAGAPRGLGAVSTVLFLERVFASTGIAEMHAKIVPRNMNSIAGARGLGGRELESDDPGHRFFVFERDRCRGAKRYVRLLERYRSRCRFRRRLAGPRER